MFIQKQYFGDVILNNDFFMFVSFGLKVPEEIKLKSKQIDVLQEKKKIIFRWQEIEEILVRPFMGPMIGLEIFVANKKSYSFNFFELAKLQELTRAIEKIQIIRKYDFNLITDPIKAFKNNLIAENWKTGEKSN